MYIYTPGAWNIQFFNVERFVGVLLGVKYHLYNYGWPLPEAFRCLEISDHFRSSRFGIIIIQLIMLPWILQGHQFPGTTDIS